MYWVNESDPLMLHGSLEEKCSGAKPSVLAGRNVGSFLPIRKFGNISGRRELMEPVVRGEAPSCLDC